MCSLSDDTLNLPKGWEVRKLGEVCEISIGKTPARGNKKLWDTEKETKNIWLSIRDLSNTQGKDVFDSREYISNSGAKLCNLVKKGALLASFKLTLGRLAFAGTELYTNEAIASLEIKNNKHLNNEYLYYYLTFFDWDAETKGDVKVKGKTLNKAKLKEMRVFIPPLPEQKRIVAILEKAFTAIAKAKTNAEQNLKNVRELFQSYLQGIFENKEYDWGEIAIKKLTELITKGSSPKWQGVNYVDKGGIFFLTSKNVGEGELLLNNKKYLEEKFNDIQKSSILKKGDVLTNIVGASIGRTAIFDLDEITNINQAVCLMRCIPNKVYNQYLMYLLNSPFFKNILHDNEVDNARANLSLTFFKNLIVPLPNLSKQKKIVENIKQVSTETKKLETIYQQKINDLDELKKSILQKAFNGEL